MTTTTSNTIKYKAKGPRDRVEVEEAEKILAQWREQQAKVNSNDSAELQITIDLSCRSWQLETLNVFQDFFNEISPYVYHLILDDIIASLMTEDGLASLKFFATTFSNSPIVTLNMDDNATGIRGVNILKPLLQIDSLKHLFFNNNGMSKEVADTLLTILEEKIEACGANNDISHSGQLETLVLGRNQIGPGGAKHVGHLLSMCNEIERFEYAGARPVVEGTRYLCDGLATMVSHNKNLVVLDMNDCHFNTGEEDDDPVHGLCTCLRSSPKLKKLILRDGSLGLDGLQRVFNALLESGAQLVHLDVSGNDVEGPEGVEAVVAFIRGGEEGGEGAPQQSLEILEYDNNDAEDDGVAQLLPGLPSSLKKLSLDGNIITEEGGQALIDAASSTLANLETLILTDNMDLEDSDDVISGLKSAFKTVKLDDDELDVPQEVVHDQEEKEDDEDVDELTQQFSQLGPQ